jgi:hypothetical protein
MQRILLKISLITTLLFFTTLYLTAQDITGIWRGNFIAAGGDQYKLEFQVSKNPQDVVTGVSYSYLTTVFYGKATMTGSFRTPEKNLVIQEIRTVEVRMSSFSVACIMKYNLTYAKSGNEEFLEGTYTSKYEKSDSLFGVRRGGDCGSGTVYLRKVTTSDFYVEPFLRDKPIIKHDTSALAKKPVSRPNPPIVKKTTSPILKKNPPPISKRTPVKKNPPAVKKTPQLVKSNAQLIIKDTIQTQTPVAKIRVPDKKIVETPAVLKSRENTLAQSIIVNTNQINIRIYDNGEIDGDTISVYVDKQLVLSHKGLSASPIKLNLQMDDDHAEHEVVMVAENMGRIPPNTSLMIIQAGDKRYQVQITSTEQRNAMVRFKYVSPENR